MGIMSKLDFLTIYRLHIIYTLIKCAGGILNVMRDNKLFLEDAHLTIITFSIFPQLTRIWHYFIYPIQTFLNNNGFKTESIIIDCHGNLYKSHFPNIKVTKFVNCYHARKLDYFVTRKIRSKLVWICDDDVFLYDPEFVLRNIESFSIDNRLAAISFMPRTRWQINYLNNKVLPMGSYCLLLNRDIITSEGLKFAAPFPNPHYPGQRYDTGDFMHEMLLRRGYKVNIVNNPDRDKYVMGFKGGSISKILEWAFCKNQLISYFKNNCSYDNSFRYHLLSFYISTRVSELYNKLFVDKYFPVFSERELIDFANQIDKKQIREDMFNLFNSVNKSYYDILRILGGIT